MFPAKVARAAGTGASVPVECCQVCGHAPLTRRAVARLHAAGEPDGGDRRRCRGSSRGFPPTCCTAASASWCSSAWRSIPSSSFPPEYPYTSGTTKLLRDNFADLYAEARHMLKLGPQDLVIDIGSNDGTLLSNFQKGGHRVLGIEPTEVGKIAAGRGIPTLQRYFTPAVAARGEARARPRAGGDGGELLRPYRGRARDRRGHSRSARRPTACSSPNRTTSSGCSTRCSTTPSITSTCATIRSTACHTCCEMHGLEVFHARPIPTHGGSIRVYAARRGVQPVNDSVAQMLGGRAARRGDAGAAQELPRRRDAVEAAAARA